MQTTVRGDAMPKPTAAPRRRRRTASTQEAIAGIGLALPALISLTVFLVVPILAAAALVFMEYDVLSPPKWAGLSNIRQLFADKRMLIMYWNTARFVFFATLFNNILGLLLAMGVNRAMPGAIKYVLRTALFFPVLTTTASLALVWNFLLAQDRGVVNYLLGQIGIAAIPWLGSSKWAVVSVVMFDVWRACGYLMVIYLAGLQGIPTELYEAAEIDGAGQFQRMRHITLPLITPTAFFATVISVLGAAQVFDNVWVLTEGGPGDASRIIVLYIYEIGFKRFEMGYAAAVSLTLFAVLILLTIVQFRVSRRWGH